MTDPPQNSLVVDTMVISWLMDERPNALGERYRELIGSAPVLLAFQTVAELRFGAIRAGWGELRRRRLERSIATFTAVQPDDERSRPMLGYARTADGTGTHSGTSCTTVTAGSRRPRCGWGARLCPTMASSSGRQVWSSSHTSTGEIRSTLPGS